ARRRAPPGHALQPRRLRRGLRRAVAARALALPPLPALGRERGSDLLRRGHGGRALAAPLLEARRAHRARADDGLHAPPGEPLPGGGRRGAERAARGHLLAAPRLAVADGRARASGVRDGPGAAGGTHGGLERDQRAPEPGRRDPAALRRHPPRSLLLRLAARAGRCAEGPLRPPAPGAVPHPPGAGGAMSGLVVEGLSVERGRRPVLDRVSLGLVPGEIVAVIGPNGAGKSSLLEAVLGFLPVAAGRVTFEGRALRDLASRARVFSFLPEEAEPPAEVRVSTLLAHAERFGRPPDGLAAALLERLGLGPLAGARAGELSRGEKRRVALFAALATGRPVLVLDEPLGVFDPLQLEDVLAVLRAREFDPLLGVVRPTLGGLYLAVSLLGPLVAARALAVEKERRTFRALLLQTGRPLGLVAAKSLAALAGVALQLVAPLVLLAVW